MTGACGTEVREVNGWVRAWEGVNSMRVTMHQSAQPHEACGSYITLRCVCVQARKREARVRHQLRGYDCTGGHVSFTLLERGRVGMPVVLTAAGT